MRQEKKKIRTVCFDRVLELCHRRIRTIASHGGMNAFFEVPGMLVGYPLYSLEECLDYVIESLRKTGFLVQVLPPPHVAVLYVSWNPEELAPPPRAAPRALSAAGAGPARGLPAPPTPIRRAKAPVSLRLI